MTSVLLWTCLAIGGVEIVPIAEPPGVRFTLAWPVGLATGDGASVDEAQAERWLRVVRLDAQGRPAEQPLLGSYRRAQDRLEFVPRFPLEPTGRYRVQFVDSAGVMRQQDHVAPALEPRPTATRVTAVYPTSDVVPANLLKFYIHFSRPMREGREIFERIRLVDDTGRDVPAPWRPTELWNSDATRLTLWIHPGRIKQGVALREVEGPVLEPGRRYTLVIPTVLRDAAGDALAAEHRKTLVTVNEDHTLPLVARWTLSPPRRGSRDPLVVVFPEPLDAALARRTIQVVDPAGRVVPGEVTLDQAERRWTFLPTALWQAGRYALEAESILEDLAGNTVVRPFEVDASAASVDPPGRRIEFMTRERK